MENQSLKPEPNSTLAKTVERRRVVTGAAWSVPVVLAAVATPLAAASVVEPEPVYDITSNFGVGWYPYNVNNTSSGVFQYDAGSSDKYHRVNGTKAGDLITNVYVEFAVSNNYSELSFQPLPGSNPDWTTPRLVRTTVINGNTYRVYQFAYTRPVVATGSTTSIPIDFYFRANTRFFRGVYVQTSRFATVNGKQVTLVRNPAELIDTNVPVSRAPRP